MGYGDWAMHPEEARFLLHRGYGVVDGKPQRVRFMHNYAYCAVVRVENTSTNSMQNMWGINSERQVA